EEHRALDRGHAPRGVEGRTVAGGAARSVDSPPRLRLRGAENALADAAACGRRRVDLDGPPGRVDRLARRALAADAGIGQREHEQRTLAAFDDLRREAVAEPETGRDRDVLVSADLERDRIAGDRRAEVHFPQHAARFLVMRAE